MNRGTGPHADSSAQTENRIQDGPYRVGQRPTFADRDGVPNRLAAAHETAAIGLELKVTRLIGVDDSDVRDPDVGVVGRTLSPTTPTSGSRTSLSSTPI